MCVFIYFVFDFSLVIQIYQHLNTIVFGVCVFLNDYYYESMLSVCLCTRLFSLFKYSFIFHSLETETKTNYNFHEKKARIYLVCLIYIGHTCRYVISANHTRAKHTHTHSQKIIFQIYFINTEIHTQNALAKCANLIRTQLTNEYCVFVCHVFSLSW